MLFLLMMFLIEAISLCKVWSSGRERVRHGKSGFALGWSTLEFLNTVACACAYVRVCHCDAKKKNPFCVS